MIDDSELLAIEARARQDIENRARYGVHGSRGLTNADANTTLRLVAEVRRLRKELEGRG